MSPQFRSLLLKDWSERRRLFWTGVLIMLYYLGYCLAYECEYRTRAFVASVYTGGLFYAFFGSILLSMSTACGENTRRTLTFSSSLPVSLQQIAWSRLIITWLCLIGPIVIVSLVASVILGSGFVQQVVPRLPDYYFQTHANHLPARISISPLAAVGFLWTTMTVACCLAIYISTMICLLGTWCRRESTVGFLGVIVILASLMTGESRSQLVRSGQWFLSDWIGAIAPESLAINWGYGDVDGSHYTDLEVAPFLTGPLAINLLFSAGLAALFAARYGRKAGSTLAVEGKQDRKPGWPRLLPSLPFFGRGPIASLVWLNARQSIPLCLSGLVVAAFMTIVQLLDMNGTSLSSGHFFEELPHMTWVAGMIWSAIVAVGIFGSEVKTGGEEFWRSKPISPKSWFWLKFVVGLCVLLLAFDVIPTIANVLFRTKTGSSSGRMAMGVSAEILCTPLLHAQCYAFTVAAICQMRRTIAAAIVGLMLFYAADQFMESLPVYPKLSTTNVLNKLTTDEIQKKSIDVFGSGYPLVYGSVAAMTLVATFIARKTIVRVHSLRFGVIVTIGLSCCVLAQAAETPSPIAAEVADGLDRLDASITSLYIKLATEDQMFASHSLNQLHIRPGVKPPEPQINRLIYECYNDGIKRAWTAFDAEGVIQSRSVFDAARLFNDYPGGIASAHSQSRAGHLGFPHPVELLLKDPGIVGADTLAEYIRTRSNASLEVREVDGERLIDLRLVELQPGQPVQPDPTGIATSNDARPPVRREIQISLNASRQYWPVKIAVTVKIGDNERNLSRTETTAAGWVESNSVQFPKIVERVGFATTDESSPVGTKSSELEQRLFKKCEVLEVEVNPRFPPDLFTKPFKAHVAYYDLDDKQYHEYDEAGNITAYIPKPRGIQGTVFVYLLLSIILAALYLLRPQSQHRTASVSR